MKFIPHTHDSSPYIDDAENNVNSLSTHTVYLSSDDDDYDGIYITNGRG